MTTIAPLSRFFSLADRLASAELVVIARGRQTLDEWADPCGDTTQRYVVVEAAVERVLRGQVKDEIRVRVAVDPTDERDSPANRVASGKPTLLLLAMDEDGDPPRYGLQHGSAFTVEGDTLELPDDLMVGPLEEIEGKPNLSTVERILARLADASAERRKRYAEADPEWETREYPEVQEVAGRVEREQRTLDTGPGDSRPVGELGATTKGRKAPARRSSK